MMMVVVMMLFLLFLPESVRLVGISNVVRSLFSRRGWSFELAP